MNGLNEFFVENITKIADSHGLDFNVMTYEDDYEAYCALVEKGVSQDEIIETFERAISLRFVDIHEKDFCLPAVKRDKIDDLVNHVKIFPYRDGTALRVAISNPEQMEYAENVMAVENYSFVFAFQFLIDMQLADIDIDADVESGLDAAEKALAAVNADSKKIILASGQDDIDELVEESEMFNRDYITIAKVQNRNLLMEYCEHETPDILLLGDNIGGKTPLMEVMLRLHSAFPSMRIIYLTGDVDPKDPTKKMTLGTLAAAGILDLITKTDISVVLLKHILDNPYTEVDVKEWLTYVRDADKKEKKNINIFVPDVVETDTSVTIYPNLFTFTSPKGGTGKTFIVEQVAIAIATCGITTPAGAKPRVGIIDLDFEGFSISKFFNTLHEKENIFTAIEEVKKVVDELGETHNANKDMEMYVDEQIHKMFKTSSKFSNIKVLGGTDRLYHSGDKVAMNKYILTYIVESVIDDFDVLLIDANTDMDTGIIYPLYSLSNVVYYILDMDWNTFHNNMRYRMYLNNEKLFQEAQSKFVLNKAVNDEGLYIALKDIETGLDLTFSNIFPDINRTTMFNLSSKAENVIQNEDKDLYETKYYFLKMANDIYPINGFDILSAQFEKRLTFKISKKALKEIEKNKKKKEELLSGKKEEKLSLTDQIKKFLNEFKFKDEAESGLKKSKKNKRGDKEKSSESADS